MNFECLYNLFTTFNFQLYYMSEEVKIAATDMSSIDSKIKHLGELFDQLKFSLMEKMDLAFDCGRNNAQFY